MTQSLELPPQPAKLDLKKLNRKFDKLHPKDVLAWCVVNIPARLVQVSDFNVDDLLITDLLYRQLRSARPVPVLFLDTLHHFPETLNLVAKAQALYNLDLRVYQTLEAQTRQQFASRHGEALWNRDPHTFQTLTKEEPLQRGLTELKAIAWITARRRDQSKQLANLPIFELDEQQRLRVNPLANWTGRETWAYAFEHDLIYNPLHDQGYPIIGDEPLTVPATDLEQAGYQVRSECGLIG